MSAIDWRMCAKRSRAPGLDVVALVGDVADDADAAVADELGGTAGGKNCAQVVGCAVVLDHRAVTIGGAVQGVAVSVGRDQVTEQAGQDHAIGGLPGWAEEQYLLVQGGGVPFAVGAGPRRCPGQPAGQQVAGQHTDALRGMVHRGDSAEADQVLDHAGEGGEVVHAADSGRRARGRQPAAFVAATCTCSGWNVSEQPLTDHLKVGFGETE